MRLKLKIFIKIFIVILFFLLPITFPFESKMRFIGTVKSDTENGFYMNPYLSCTEPCYGYQKSEIKEIFIQTKETYPEGAEIEVHGVLRASITGKFLKIFILIPKSIKLTE